MKINKEKYLIYSITFLTLGWLYFFTIDYLNYIDFSDQFRPGLFIFVAKIGKYNTIWFKLIAIGFGLLSLYFSYNSKSTINIKSRVLLISISLLLIIMSSVVFPNFTIRYLI